MTSEPKILAMNEMRMFYANPNVPLSKKNVNQIHIFYDIPFGLPLSSGDGFVKINSEKTQVKLKVKQKPSIKSNESDEIKTPKLGGSESMRIHNDRFGKLNYTSVKFIIHLETPTHFQKIEFEKFIDRTIIVINRILDGIRIISEDYLPRNFIKKDIDAYNLECIDEDEKLVYGFSAFIVGAEDQDKHMSNKLLDKNQLKQLQKILENDIEMDFDYELELNSKDHLLFENYRIACIEIQNAIEYIISNIIRSDLIKKGKNEGEVLDILKNGLDKLKPFLKDATSEDIFQTIEYGNWHQYCYKVRNEVIHKGKLPSKDEATKAVSHGKIFLHFLKKFEKGKY